MVHAVVGLELLSACQGLEFHRPLKTTPPLEALHKLVRSVARYFQLLFDHINIYYLLFEQFNICNYKIIWFFN